MIEFLLTDSFGEHITETCCHATFALTTRSGLHPTEMQLIESLAALRATPRTILLAGGRTGATALIAHTLFPEASLTIHAFDLHHARVIQRNLATNGIQAACLVDAGVRSPTFTTPAATPIDTWCTIACTTSFPDEPYDCALFMNTANTSAELAIDQLEMIATRLIPAGHVIIAAEGDTTAFLKQIKILFTNIHLTTQTKNTLLVNARGAGAPATPRTFSATFQASLPGETPVALISLPGVFCHRRPDAGGLALAEVAARDIAPDANILDIGCGCGLVALLLAAKQQRLNPATPRHVTVVDSHARATAATLLNTQALGITSVDVILSDTGVSDLRAACDLAVGNPPYYSDYRIADIFLAAAYATLRPGGRCLMVAKSAKGLAERQTRYFHNATPITRRGYTVIDSTR